MPEAGREPADADHDLHRAVAAELGGRHGCHTVILYGSRAKGTHHAASDIDVLGVRPDGETCRDARLWQGHYLDAFIHPESALATLDASWLKLRPAIVLQQAGTLGDDLLSRVERLHAAGPPLLREDERLVLLLWMDKMLDRVEAAGVDDVEGHYRWHWLLMQLLEDYFALRTRWYPGSKDGFAWLREHDPQTYRLFAEALRPGAAVATLAPLVARVAAKG